MKRKRSLFCSLFVWVSLPIFSQDNTVTTGGDISNSTGSVSFTFGQVFFDNTESEHGSLNEGIQQPYSSEIITGIELTEIQLELFPNPTRETAILKTERDYIGLLHYSLFDETGRLIETHNLNNSETQINLSEFANGIYILTVHNSSETVKSFQIIKTK